MSSVCYSLPVIDFFVQVICFSLIFMYFCSEFWGVMPYIFSDKNRQVNPYQMKGKKKFHSTAFLNAKVTATISISLVLFLLGLIVLLFLYAKDISTHVKENFSFSVVLDDNIREADIASLQKKLNQTKYIKSATFISKQQAAQEMIQDLGENPEVFLGYNPLPALFEIKLHSNYASNDSIAVIESSLKTNRYVQDVIVRKDLIQSINENMRRIGLILLLVAGILSFISFALINNTIRLMIYAKRFSIYTMKLVGATNRFIRRPFISSSIFTGIYASIIAIAMIIGLVYYISIENRTIDIDFFNYKLLGIMTASVLCMGIFISAIATFIAVNRYLKMEGGDLYYI